MSHYCTQTRQQNRQQKNGRWQDRNMTSANMGNMPVLTVYKAIQFTTMDEHRTMIMSQHLLLEPRMRYFQKMIGEGSVTRGVTWISWASK